jgi:hypothetical protein
MTGEVIGQHLRHKINNIFNKSSLIATPYFGTTIERPAAGFGRAFRRFVPTGTDSDSSFDKARLH